MENKKPKSKRSKFIDDCYARVVKGDMSVFEECFTPDYKFAFPESRHFSPDGFLYGKFALETFSRYIRNDAARWKSIEFKTLYEIESDDKLVRVIHYLMKNPNQEYGGFEKLPPDLEVTLTVVQIFTFRDEKICSCFDVYDMLGHQMQMAQGDYNKCADSIRGLGAWMNKQKKLVEKGELPLPDPGKGENVVF